MIEGVNSLTGEKYIDARDIEPRIAFLASLRADLVTEVETRKEAINSMGEGDDPGTLKEELETAEEELASFDDEDDGKELIALRSLLEDVEQNAGDHRSASLILESEFEDYARQFAEDVGAIKRDMEWPCNHIDWTAAAAELQQDYTTLTFMGDDYLVRS